MQVVLFAVILLAPPVPAVMFPLWLRILGLGLLVVGGVFGTGGVLALGSNLTAFPKPIEGGTLVTKGMYRLVRHPIYTGLILGTLGLGIFRAKPVGDRARYRVVHLFRPEVAARGKVAGGGVSGVRGVSATGKETRSVGVLRWRPGSGVRDQESVPLLTPGS